MAVLVFDFALRRSPVFDHFRKQPGPIDNFEVRGNLDEGAAHVAWDQVEQRSRNWIEPPDAEGSVQNQYWNIDAREQITQGATAGAPRSSVLGL